MKFPIVIQLHRPMDARGWTGLGVYVLVLILLFMMWEDRSLLKDDFFKTLATLIIGTGFINGPVGWAYQATKSGVDAAESSARIAESAATAALSLPIVDDGSALKKSDTPTGTAKDPVYVKGEGADG